MKIPILPLVSAAALILSACGEREVIVRERVVHDRSPMPAVIVEERGLPPYPGAHWVPGHWVWRYDRWVWIRGHWRANY